MQNNYKKNRAFLGELQADTSNLKNLILKTTQGSENNGETNTPQKKHMAFACHMALGFQLKELKKKWGDKVLFSDPDGLLIGLDSGYAAIFRYGVLVYWNIPVKHLEAIEKLLKEYSKGAWASKEWRRDQMTLILNAKQTVADHSRISLDGDEPEKLHLVFLHLAQSVAMDSFSGWCEKLLEDTRMHTTELETKGRISLKGNQLKRFIGKVLNLKNKVAENLYILDAPELVWEDQHLESLHKELVFKFDLKDRYKSIQEQLSIIKENLDLFKELSFHRESSTLEWIIILLIFVEIIDLFMLKIL